MDRGHDHGRRRIDGRSCRASVIGYEVIDFIGEGAGSLLYAVSHPQTDADLRPEARHAARRTRTSGSSSSSRPSTRSASSSATPACAARSS